MGGIYTSMHFPDFLEGLCRVAELKAWPTNTDLEEAGCTTMMDFYKKAEKDSTLLRLLDDNVVDVNSIGDQKDDENDNLESKIDKLLQLIVARCDRRLIDGTIGGGAFTALTAWEEK